MQTKNYSVETILSNLRIDALNEMQQAAIDATAQNNNVVLLSPTGSGKTLAFLLPIVEALDVANKKSQALIIVPSRELALQIETVFKAMGTGLKVTTCYGGHKREIEENSLIQPPALLIGTPGRLADHIRRENITTDSIHTIVFDEFDKSLESGFVEEISFIVSSLPAVQKRILTSATEAIEIPEFIGAGDAVRLNYLPEEDAAPTEALAIQILHSPDKDKIDTLFKLLCYVGARSSIIFCNHRESVERVSKALADKGITNTYYHGSMEQREREVALAKFRNGSIDFLVTTDLASRGLDIPHIRYIIHYHLPTTEEIFTHRNGRTARMDASGTAILILNEEEKMPSYITTPVLEIDLPKTVEIPDKPKWTTLFIAAGKKDKVNKVDIVGFFTAKGELKKEEIGLIEVKDFFSFVALRKSKVSPTLQLIKDEKLKGRKIKIDV
ncbi:MAG TPA: DEAD/DEAH box helicase, partial [Flavisolibacter sp.]|nr:DEAD/DEAH box helicase [Flavisolibacter sp.]